MASKLETSAPDAPFRVVLRFFGEEGFDGPRPADSGSVPLGLALYLQNRAGQEQRVSLSSPGRYGEDMHLALTPVSGEKEISYVVAQKHFEPRRDDKFSIEAGAEVRVHLDQFKEVGGDETKTYFMMWGVSQIFRDLAPGTYFAKASFTVRDGTWTGTLRSEPVSITLP